VQSAARCPFLKSTRLPTEWTSSATCAPRS